MKTFEKHYSIKEISRMWGISGGTVHKLFDNESGVIRIGNPEGRFKRKYITLRIPESVMIRVHAKLTQQ
jgi:hypothetical protein